ncbi:MAG: YibE/F family protein, partial [Clostridium sp.]|nr:YibE/F family protein [Clostridium sp.]
GAIMDTAMAITSSLFEFNEVNSDITIKELIKMGFSVGRDILGTTVNTLFFATIGETMMISILFMKNNYTLESVINSKEFYQNLFSLAISNIGCLLIIPISIFICTYVLKGDNKVINNIKFYCNRLEKENNN